MGQGRLSPSSSFWPSCFPWRPFSSLAFFSSLLSAECGVGGGIHVLSPSGSPFIFQTIFQTIFFPLGAPLPPSDRLISPRGPLHPSDHLLSPVGAPLPPSDHLLSPGGIPSSFTLSSFPWGNPVHPPEGVQAAGERAPHCCQDSQSRPLRNHHAPFAGMEKTQKPGPMRLASPETVMYCLLVYRSARGSGSLGPFTFSLIILPSFSKSLLILPPSGTSSRAPS